MKIQLHVHLLVALSSTITLADLMHDVKGGSSRLMTEQSLPGEGFKWQEGYGAFSVSASQIGTVKSYIENQEDHHRKKTFQDEFLEILEKHGVEYDPRYVWG